MSPSLNSTLVTKPPTRARTWTSSTASNRPVNSSQSVTVRLTGCATVTGGGADAACWADLSPHADKARASSTINGLASRNRTAVDARSPTEDLDRPIEITGISLFLAHAAIATERPRG